MKGPDDWGHHSTVQVNLQSPITSLPLPRSLLDCCNCLCAIQLSLIRLGVKTEDQSNNCALSIPGGFQLPQTG